MFSTTLLFLPFYWSRSRVHLKLCSTKSLLILLFCGRVALRIMRIHGKPLLVEIRSDPENLRPAEVNEPSEICKEQNDSAKSIFKLNTTASSSVCELLECPVCLNSMYPPIHQVRLWRPGFPLSRTSDKLLKLRTWTILAFN